MVRPPFDEEDDDDSPRDEGPGLVGRLLRTGVAAPNVAMGFLAEQVAGWKKDFLGIFQSEIRRFLDRQDPGEEMRKMIDGKRLELVIRLVDDAPRPRAAAAGKGAPAAKTTPRGTGKGKSRGKGKKRR